MVKKKEHGVTSVDFAPNTSIKVELSQSDLISVIMADQIEIWEKELKEAEQKLTDFDTDFKPDEIFNAGIGKIIRDRCGIFGTIEMQYKSSYLGFRRSNNYPVQVGARQDLNGIDVSISYQIPPDMVKKLMKSELDLLENKEKERVALVSDIVRIQELIDNQSRFESKIRAEITRKILNEGGNEGLSKNLDAMRVAIFSNQKLLK
jgi:hypothetical protein